MKSKRAEEQNLEYKLNRTRSAENIIENNSQNDISQIDEEQYRQFLQYQAQQKNQKNEFRSNVQHSTPIRLNVQCILLKQVQTNQTVPSANQSTTQKHKYKVLQTDLNRIYADTQIIWNKRDHFKVKVNPIEPTILELKLTFDNKKFLSKREIDLTPLIEKPGSWQSDNYQMLTQDGNELANVYLQIQWRDILMHQRIQDEPKVTYKFEGLVVQKDKYHLKKHPTYNFMADKALKNVSLADQFKVNFDYVYINIIACKNLHKASLKDPDSYCKYILFQGNNVIIRSQTESIIEHPDPKYNHENEIKVDSIWFQGAIGNEKAIDIAPLKLSIKVYDYQMGQDVLLGQADLNINRIILQPGKWINDIFPLNNKSNLNSNMQVYLQAQYRPYTLMDHQKAPKRLL